MIPECHISDLHKPQIKKAMKAITVLRRRTSTMTFTLTAGLLLCSMLPVPTIAAVLAPEEGGLAGPKDWPANPTQHQAVIKREAKDAKQAAMITAAESAQASKEAMGLALKADDPNDPLGLAQPKEVQLPVGDKVWWYKEQLGVRIPCAITGDAITYFTGIVAENAKKAFKSYAMPSSRLEYLAGVQLHKDFKLDDKAFKDVNVVTMKLSFSANFTAESTSGMSFEKTRIVILDSENKVLHISGDGPTEVMVLMM